MPSDTIEDPRAYIDGTFTEEQFLQQVKKLANNNDWLCYHTRNSRGSDPGFPDLVLVRSGRLVFAELKRERGKVSVAQALWLAELAFNDHTEVYTWRPSDWDTIVELLT